MGPEGGASDALARSGHRGVSIILLENTYGRRSNLFRYGVYMFGNFYWTLFFVRGYMIRSTNGLRNGWVVISHYLRLISTILIENKKWVTPQKSWNDLMMNQNMP